MTERPCERCGKEPARGIMPRGAVGPHPWCLSCQNKDAVRRIGRRKASNGRPREVPTNYPPHYAEAWLEGYDEAAAALDQAGGKG